MSNPFKVLGEDENVDYLEAPQSPGLEGSQFSAAAQRDKFLGGGRIPGGEYKPRPAVIGKNYTDPFRPPNLVRQPDGTMTTEKNRSSIDVLAEGYWQRLQQEDPTGNYARLMKQQIATNLQEAVEQKRITRSLGPNDVKNKELQAVYTQFAQEHGMRIGEWVPNDNENEPSASATLEWLTQPPSNQAK
jgi:hypothetical protein